MAGGWTGSTATCLRCRWCATSRRLCVEEVPRTTCYVLRTKPRPHKTREDGSRGGLMKTALIGIFAFAIAANAQITLRSEEYTSELQSPCNLVCRLLLE